MQKEKYGSDASLRQQMWSVWVQEIVHCVPDQKENTVHTSFSESRNTLVETYPPYDDLLYSLFTLPGWKCIFYTWVLKSRSTSDFQYPLDY